MYFEDLCGTKLPYRFEHSLVNGPSLGGGGSSGGNDPSGGASGGVGGDSDSGGRGGADTGRGSDKAGNTVGGDVGRGGLGTGAGGYGGDGTGTSDGGGSDADIDTALDNFFDEIDAEEESYRNTRNAFGLTPADVTKVKNTIKSLIAKGLTAASFTNPATGLLALGTKLATGKTIGEALVEAGLKAYGGALAQSGDESAAEAAVAGAVEGALSTAANDKDAGGSEGAPGALQDLADAVVTTPTTPTTPDLGTWDDYVSKFFGTPSGMQSAKDMIQGQADFMKEQFQSWQGDREDSLASLTGATQKQDSLLDDLIGQSRESKGLFSPVKFKLAGQEIAFVPRAQREQAAQMAGFGQTGLSNASGLYGAETGFADAVLAGSSAASPNAGGLAYLDQLRDLAKTGEGLSLARDSLTQTGSIADRTADQNEPGTLDYLKAIDSLMS